VCDPADGSKRGENQIIGYTRRRARGCTFGRGFDSPRLHSPRRRPATYFRFAGVCRPLGACSKRVSFVGAGSASGVFAMAREASDGGASAAVSRSTAAAWCAG